MDAPRRLRHVRNKQNTLIGEMWQNMATGPRNKEELVFTWTCPTLPWASNNICVTHQVTTYYGECARRATSSNGPRQDSSALFSTFDELANDSSVNLCSDNNTERASLCFYDNAETIFKTTQIALSSMPTLDFISICIRNSCPAYFHLTSHTCCVSLLSRYKLSVRTTYDR